MTSVSVLIPLYHGDRVAWFERTLRSVDRQTRRPDEVVIVVDGPIPATHEPALELAGELFGERLVVERLERKVGVGLALNAGFARCTGEFIARIDADDLMAPDRLAIQLPILIEGRDAVGSALTEFDAQTERIVGVRRFPVGEQQVLRSATFVCPLGAPATTWRASTVRAAGGVGNLTAAEDYDLVVRALRTGARMTNTEEPLTFFRTGAAMYRRRGGRAVLRGEWRLQRRLLSSEFIGRTAFVRNVVVRCGFCLTPWRVKRWVRDAALRPAEPGTALPA